MDERTCRDELLAFLAEMTHGEITDIDRLASLLAQCWEAIDGHHIEGMEAYKLHRRIERPAWNPPLLTFSIERHGGTVLGSSRAEKHRYTVNLELMNVQVSTEGFRQIRPMQRPLDVEPLVIDITDAVISKKKDPRLSWLPDGSVRVEIDQIIPSNSAAKQTLLDRRKRFRAALGKAMEEKGWKLVSGYYTFARS